MATDPKEAERRAAALKSLRNAPPPETDSGSFWQQHGAKVIAAVSILLGLWLVSRAVGGFLRASAAETDRAQEELSRGRRR